MIWALSYRTLLFIGGVIAASTALPEATPTFAAEMYLAVGAGGHRMLSNDGAGWEKHAELGKPGHDQNDLNVCTFFRGAAFVGGGFNQGRLMATRDGVNWSDGVIPGSGPIFGLEVVGDTLYAIDLRGKVFRSLDGEQWKLAATPVMPSKTHWIRCTSLGNGIIVGSGDFGPVITFSPETDDISVTQMAGQTEKNPGIGRVAFGNGTFVIAGQDGLLATTTDGKSFVNNKTAPERGNVNSVVWTGDHFLASCKQGSFSSTDGNDWKPVDTKLPYKMDHCGPWLFGWSWPYKIQRSGDGRTWQPVSNERQWYVKDIAFGGLAGSGDPPAVPPAPTARVR